MKITKWKVMQKDSAIGLILLIMSFVAFLLIVLGPTTIGAKYSITASSIWQDPSKIGTKGIPTTTRLMVGDWTQAAEGLAVTGMVLSAIAWLAICVGWYNDPTKLDERITLTVSAGTLLIGMILAIAGPAVEYNNFPKGVDKNKGFLAGMEILAIIPSIVTLLLMVEPLMIVYNPKNRPVAKQPVENN